MVERMRDEYKGKKGIDDQFFPRYFSFFFLLPLVSTFFLPCHQVNNTFCALSLFVDEKTAITTLL